MSSLMSIIYAQENYCSIHLFLNILNVLIWCINLYESISALKLISKIVVYICVIKVIISHKTLFSQNFEQWFNWPDKNSIYNNFMWVQTPHSVKVVNFACYLCWYLSWFRNTCPGSANLQMGLRISSSTNVIFDQHSLTGSLWLAHDSFTFALINTFQNLNLLLHSSILCKIQNYFALFNPLQNPKLHLHSLILCINRKD